MILKGTHYVNHPNEGVGKMHRARKIPITELNQHLTCILCKGYFIDATTIIECLHTFCRSCIVKYLETSKYCPVCDVQVHKTKPLLNIRPDKTLQDIVYKLVPRLFQNEMQRRRHFYSNHPDAKPSGLEQRGEASYQHLLSPDETICLSLNYHGNSGPPRYLQCHAAVSVSHLQKLIRAKYDLNDNHRIDILHNQDCLNSYLTLIDVAYIYLWRRKGPLELTYRIYENTVKKLKLDEGSTQADSNNWKEVQLRISENGEISVTGIQDTTTDLKRTLKSDVPGLDYVIRSCTATAATTDSLNLTTINSILNVSPVVDSVNLCVDLGTTAASVVTGNSSLSTSVTTLSNTGNSLYKPGSTFSNGSVTVPTNTSDVASCVPGALGTNACAKVTDPIGKVDTIACGSFTGNVTKTICSQGPKVSVGQILNSLTTEKASTADTNSQTGTTSSIAGITSSTGGTSTNIAGGANTNITGNSTSFVSNDVMSCSKTTCSINSSDCTAVTPTISNANPIICATGAPLVSLNDTLSIVTTSAIGTISAVNIANNTVSTTCTFTSTNCTSIASKTSTVPSTKIGTFKFDQKCSSTSTNLLKSPLSKHKLECGSNEGEPVAKQPKQTILNHTLGLQNLSNNHPLKKHSQMSRTISETIPTVATSNVNAFTKPILINKNLNNAQSSRPGTPLTQQWVPNKTSTPAPPCYTSYSPIINVPKIQPSTSIAKITESKLCNAEQNLIVPTTQTNINNKPVIKTKQSTPIGYKTLRDPPKTWNPQISRTNLNRTVPDPKAELKNVRPPKFFKIRNNLPRYLGNPASGVKPMYQVHLSPEKDKAESRPDKSEIKKHSIVKIDPKTLKPISERAPEISNLSRSSSEQSDLKINTSSVPIFNPLKLQSSPKSERKSPKSPHSPKSKGSSPSRRVNFTPPNPFIPNLGSPNVNPNQFLYTSPPGFPPYDPRMMAAYQHFLYGQQRMPFPPSSIPGLNLDLNPRKNFDLVPPTSPKMLPQQLSPHTKPNVMQTSAPTTSQKNHKKGKESKNDKSLQNTVEKLTQNKIKESAKIERGKEVDAKKEEAKDGVKTEKENKSKVTSDKNTKQNSDIVNVNSQDVDTKLVKNVSNNNTESSIVALDEKN